MFWFLTAAMTIMVAAAILRPFLGRTPAVAAEPAAAYDLGVYRDQLREVDRDVKRGVLTADEAERLRTEIGRKILDADRAMARQAAPAARGAPWIAVALLALAVAGSATIYGRLGQPAMPDLPLAVRIAAADERLGALPAQAEAEARAPERPAPQADPDYLRLIEQLRAAVAGRPDDAQGLALLAEHETRLGNTAAARQAQERLIALRGAEVTAPDHVRLAALMIEGAGGFVSAEARGEIEAALRIDPADGQARYLQGLMYAQNDRPDLAFGIWRALLENGPADAPWTAPIRQLMPELAWLAGEPDYQPPPLADLAGPDAAAVAAAGEMTPEEQRQMIAGMVRNLEARLTTDGGPPAEWARLVTSLVRIGEEARAREMLARARAIYDGTPQAMEIIDRAAATVGLAGAE